MIDYTDQGQRQTIISAISEEENENRKSRSLKECEIYNDDIRDYVLQYLKCRFSQETVDDIPIIASINLAKKIVNQEASIYTNPPTRTFTNLSDEQKDVAELIYNDMMVDFKLLQANRFFRLQKQHHIKIIPQGGKLIMRNYKNHHLDAEPLDMNPEMAGAYIFSSFNKYFGNELREYSNADGRNTAIADEDDYQSKRKYIVWTPEFNFVMDDGGYIINLNEDGTVPVNPLIEYGIMPVVDIAMNKDFEYFNSYGNALSDFCVEFNGHLSSLAQVVDLQGHAQAFLKGPKELLPDNLNVGPHRIIHLPIDPDSGAETDFGFANPASDIAGSQAFVESLLSMFLSSRGAEPDSISGNPSGGKSFSSGIERLLSMIEKFEASREDLSLFERVENDIWKIVKAWHNTLAGTDLLDSKYTTTPFPDDSEIMVEFSEPALVTTEKEKIEAIQLKLENGLISQRMAVKEFHDVDEDRTDEILKEIEEETGADNKEQDELPTGPFQEVGGFEQNPENES